MSYWTHVAGIVRVGDIRIFDDQIGPDWDAIFGKECLFDAPREVWDDAMEHPDKYLPMGSEGTLRKTVWVNPDLSHADAYTVSIFGDLRDYDSPETIIEWFKKIVNSVAIDVRQACITATNGYKSSVWGYNFGEVVK
jgi:hypothetical protein